MPRLQNRTRILVLQHPRERFHPLGTVRLARLSLRHFELATFGENFAHQDSWLQRPLPAGTALLYPGPTAEPLATLPAERRPSTLVVLDGTWSQARAMRRSCPALAGLPEVSLAPTEPGRYRIRAEPAPHCRSTVEAIVQALATLESDLLGLDELLAAMTAMIDRHLALRAERPAVPFHRERRAPRRVSIPHELATLSRLVIVYGEFQRQAGRFAPVTWTALRLEDGAVFESLVRPEGGAPPDAVHLRRMGVEAAHFSTWPGQPLAEVQAAFAAFLRPADLLVAWNQSTLDYFEACLRRTAHETLLLKAAYCNSEHRACGELRDVAAGLGLACRALPLHGRAASRLAEAEAMAVYLHERLEAESRVG
jgi:DTW domain-containing protein